MKWIIIAVLQPVVLPNFEIFPVAKVPAVYQCTINLSHLVLKVTANTALIFFPAYLNFTNYDISGEISSLKIIISLYRSDTISKGYN